MTHHQEKCGCHYQCGCNKGECNCYSLTPPSPHTEDDFLEESNPEPATMSDYRSSHTEGVESVRKVTYAYPEIVEIMKCMRQRRSKRKDQK